MIKQIKISENKPGEIVENKIDVLIQKKWQE